MGSTSEPPRPPEGIVQLNDSVWELYKPRDDEPCQVEVLLFHGIEKSDDYTEAFWKTWLSRDEKVLWPKDWLSSRIPAARIMSISYDSAIQSHDGAMDSFLIAENLIQDIIMNDENPLGQNCPVILVGHCLGGIIIKEVILACINTRAESPPDSTTSKKIGKFLSNCKGVFYYSPPHAGSRVADAIAGNPDTNDSVIGMLRTLSKHTARTNSKFAKVRKNLHIDTQAVVENLPTEYQGFKAQFVEEASARQDIDIFSTAIGTDHFNVCRPKNSRTDGILTKLVSFINTAAEGTITVVSLEDTQIAQEMLM